MTSVNIGVRNVDLVLKIFTNNPELLSNDYFDGIPHPNVISGRAWNIYNQRANFDIEFRQGSTKADGYMYILNHDIQPEEASLVMNDSGIIALGNWRMLEELAKDRRYTLLGNQGALLKLMLRALELRGVYSFHACGLYDIETHRVYLVLGGMGSGKSALLLAAINSGEFRAFSTELVHASIENQQLTFYRGSLRNNVRLGHLIYDFPELRHELGLEFSKLQDPWGVKAQIDLSSYSVKWDRIDDPEVIIVLPRIEEELKHPSVKSITRDQLPTIKRRLLENLSEKICTTTLLYERIPTPILETWNLIKSRAKFVDGLLSCGNITEAKDLYASPQNCIKHLK